MPRDLFTDHALEVAPRLLGAKLTLSDPAGPVTVRITEVEAYHGVGTPAPYDPGSHARDRQTARNASMFGPPGHAYVYFTYGMHFALNLVCSPAGIASGVLLRAGEVIEGVELAQWRRHEKRAGSSTVTNSAGPGRAELPAHALARGPGNLATALGITRELHDGVDLFAPPFTFVPLGKRTERAITAQGIARGPRVGVAGVAGGPEFPWRFWLPGEPSVSAFRPGRGAPRSDAPHSLI